ncbi:MAG: acyl-CoA dehydrogenase [Hahellaceae bacterium]|nr:acyl-CoA dehydrogenase [Hahellaceae bacterium]
MTDINLEALQAWVGRQETLEDDISLFPAKALAAALDCPVTPQKGDALPPFWEWLYFLPTPTAAATGADGHPAKGGFLPPVPLPRRMWAAGEAEYLQPLVIGQPAQRISTIESVELKSGSTGPLVFVNVRHDILQNGTRCVTQTQNLVYREHPAPDAPQPPAKAAPGDAQWSRTVKPDPVLLFRYSALTYNGHRIHYDRPYALQDEGYPALVVHGPLLVTLILDLLRHSLPDAPLRKLRFRATRPTFDSHPFAVQGKAEGQSLRFWSADHEGALCMTLDAETGVLS